MAARMLLLPLFVVAALLAAVEVRAVEFSIRGFWMIMLEQGEGGNFVKRGRDGRQVGGWGRWGEDRFRGKSCARLQLDAVASEALSGVVYFEIGSTTWGEARKGGAMGSGGGLEIKHSYLNWNIPSTRIKCRMGIQRIALPDFVTNASQVFDADVAGVAFSLPLSEWASMTAFWARPFNDNWTDEEIPRRRNFQDNADVWGLTLPLDSDGFRVTPWGMMGAFGANAFRAGDEYYGRNAYLTGGLGLSPAFYMLPQRGVAHARAYATAFWLGVTGEIAVADPFRFSWSADYGSVDSGVSALNRHGWYAAVLAEYKLDWGTPGIYAWYSSGDDGNPRNGSERMPSMEANNEGSNKLSPFGMLGTWTVGRDALLGFTFMGTRGLGVRLADIGVFDRQTHTFRVNFYQGTNAAGMAGYITGRKTIDGYQGHVPAAGRQIADFNSVNGYGLYLTEDDYAAEIGLRSDFQLSDKVHLLMEANYIALWLDQSSSVWGGYDRADGSRVHANSTRDAWNVNLSFIYLF
ncbi:outer membrane homotrimeric porin [uncultured Desulfovibrio sp.]|uniref:outer membrane homotrimeric porin n=1 Tax=uncultured Desulfovibrio sp. TaxID=167968 RepID=UPI00262AEB6B|nr:outer membrane homotrimeric porin [uncultured Desulfovibrio sp.]